MKSLKWWKVSMLFIISFSFSLNLENNKEEAKFYICLCIVVHGHKISLNNWNNNRLLSTQHNVEPQRWWPSLYDSITRLFTKAFHTWKKVNSCRTRSIFWTREFKKEKKPTKQEQSTVNGDVSKRGQLKINQTALGNPYLMLSYDYFPADCLFTIARSLLISTPNKVENNPRKRD